MKKTISMFMSAVILASIIISCEQENPVVTTQNPQTVNSFGKASTGLVIFGPEIYTRSTGQPVTDIREFSIQGDFTDTELVLTNGGTDKKTKVTSCFIILNADTIVFPNEIGKHVESIRKTIALEQVNVLQVKLAGKAGSYLTITITGNPSIPTNGLVAFYPFNGNANDESGNNLNGVVNGATICSDRHDELSSAYHFNGVDYFIKVTDSELLHLSDSGTFSVWINIDVGTSYDIYGYRNILSKGAVHGSLNADYSLGICRPGGLFYFQAQYSTTSGIEGMTSSAISQGEWHHLVITYDYLNGKILYYVDADLVKTLEYSLQPFRSSAYPLYIGCRYESPMVGAFQGCIDDVRIYNRALSQEEIYLLERE